MKTKYMQSTHNPFNSQGKMFHHIENLNNYKNTGDSVPILIEVNLTNLCNLRCKWCISSYSHKVEHIEYMELIRFLSEYKSAGGKAVTWSGGGEPTQHPKFASILKATKSIGLNQGLMTNGLFRKDLVDVINDCCDWVRVSLDTSSSERYKELKGIEGFTQVMLRIGDLDKSKVKVGVNMNLPQEAYDYREDINFLIILCKNLKVKYLQIRPVLPRVIKGETFNRDILLDQMFFLKTIDLTTNIVSVSWDKFYDLERGFNRNYTKCKGHIFECVLDANGDLNVCMYFLKNKDFVFGNIYEQSFSQIWLSDKRKEVINRCNNLDFSKCQMCCKCHEINKLIDYIDNPTEDVNFI